MIQHSKKLSVFLTIVVLTLLTAPASAASGALADSGTPAGGPPSVLFQTASSIEVNAGSGQITFVSTEFFGQLSVLVTDSGGTPVQGEVVTFTAPASGASGTFGDSGTNETSAVTDANGIAEAAPFTANDLEGIYNVEASVTGLTTQFQLKNVYYNPVLYFDLAVDNTRNLLYGSASVSGTIHIISTDTLEPVGLIEVGLKPSGIDISSDGNELAVALNGQAEVAFIDLDTRQVSGRVTPNGSGNPYDVIYGRPGRLYMTGNGSSVYVNVIDTVTKTDLSVSSISVGWYSKLAITPDKNTLFVNDSSGDKLQKLDVTTDTIGIHWFAPDSPYPAAIAVNADGSQVYNSYGSAWLVEDMRIQTGVFPVQGREIEHIAAKDWAVIRHDSQISIVDTSTFIYPLIYTQQFSGEVGPVKANQAGTTLYVSTSFGVEAVSLPETITPTPPPIDPQPSLYADMVIDETRGVLYGSDDVGGKIEIVSLASLEVVNVIDVGGHSRPIGMDISPDGNQLAVTLENNAKIALIDLNTLEIVDFLFADNTPYDVIYGRPGRIYAITRLLASEYLIVYDQITMEKVERSSIYSIYMGSSLEITTDENTIFLSGDRILKYDITTDTPVLIDSDFDYGGEYTISPLGNEIYFSNGYVLSGDLSTTLGTFQDVGTEIDYIPARDWFAVSNGSQVSVYDVSLFNEVGYTPRRVSLPGTAGVARANADGTVLYVNIDGAVVAIDLTEWQLNILEGAYQNTRLNTPFPYPFKVELIDFIGNPIAGESVSFTAPASGASGTFTDSGTNETLAVTDANGIATAAVFTANGTEGSYLVDAAQSGVSAPVQFGLTNYVETATVINVHSGHGQISEVNTAFFDPFKAIVKDQHGKPMSGVTVTFTAPTFGASGTFGDSGTNETSAVTDADGIATAAIFTANGTDGIYFVDAAVAGVASPARFGLTNYAITATTIEIQGGSGQLAEINTAFADPFGVLVKDQFNNPMPGVTVTFTAPASGASGAFADSGTNETSAVTDANGIATAAGFTANGTEGVYFVDAAVVGVASLAQFDLTNYLFLATTIEVQSGSGQIVEINAAFADPFDALVKDQNGLPMAGVTVTFTAPASGASGTFVDSGTNETSVVTDANGIATAAVFTANGIEGVYFVDAAVSGIASPAQFELTNYVITATTIEVQGGSGQIAEVNTAFTDPFGTLVKDQYGLPMAGVTVTFTAPVSGASGTFAGSGTNETSAVTDANGIATAAVFTANGSEGGYFVDAAVAGVASPAQFNLTNYVITATTIEVQGGSGQVAEINTVYADPFNALVKDQFNNPMSGVTVTFTAPVSGASGTFADSGTNKTSAVTDANGIATAAVFTANGIDGVYTLNATASGVVSPAEFQLSNYIPLTPSSIDIDAGSGQTAFVSTQFIERLSVVVRDEGGTPVQGEAVTFTAPVSGASGTFADSGTNVTTSTTDVNGVATAASFTANGTEGIYNVEASISGLTTQLELNNVVYVPVLYFDLVLDNTRNLLYGSDNANGTIHVLSTATLEPVGLIEVGLNPSGMDISPDRNELAVALNGQGEVAFIDLDSWLVSARGNPAATANPSIVVKPYDLIYGRLGRLYVVGNGQYNYVYVMDTVAKTGISKSTAYIYGKPRLAITSDTNTLFVNEYDNKLHILDVTTDTPSGWYTGYKDEIISGYPSYPSITLALNADESQVYTASGAAKFVGDLGTQTGVFQVYGKEIEHIAANDWAVISHDSQISIIDTSTFIYPLIFTQQLSGTAGPARVNPSGTTLYVSTSLGVEAVALPETITPTPPPIDPQPALYSDMVIDESRGVLYGVDDAGGKIEVVSLTSLEVIDVIDVGGHSFPTRIDMSPDGGQLAVVLRDNGKIAFIDLNTREIMDYIFSGFYLTDVVFGRPGRIYSFKSDTLYIHDSVTMEEVWRSPMSMFRDKALFLEITSDKNTLFLKNTLYSSSINRLDISTDTPVITGGITPSNEKNVRVEIAITPLGGKVFTGDGYVLSGDLSTVLGTFQDDGVYIEYVPTRDWFAVSNSWQVSVYNVSLFTEVGYNPGRVSLPNTAGVARANADGSILFVNTYGAVVAVDLTGHYLSISRGSPQNTGPDMTFPIPFEIEVTDLSGNPIAGEVVTFTAPVTGPSGTFTDTNTNVTTAITDTNGKAVAAPFTANSLEGAYTVEVMANNVSQAVFFELENQNLPPVVEIVEPFSPFPSYEFRFDPGAEIAFEGTASDREDGDLTANLTWTSDIDGLIGTGGQFNYATLSYGVHTITVQVTDSEGLSGTDELIVHVNTSPTVTIEQPLTGADFYFGQTIDFSGTASDVEDGDLSANITWSSNRDGPIGSGGSFLVSDLVLGDHIIAAYVIDSLGFSAVDTITITVNPIVTIEAFSGFQQSTPVNTTFPQLLKALVKDTNGSPVEGVEVTFTAPSSGANGTFSDTGTITTSAFTNIDGIATAADFTANDIRGAYTVTASVTGTTAQAQFQLTNTRQNSGIFRPYYTIPAGYNSARVVGIGDFNNDGRNDVAIVDRSTNTYPYQYSLYVYLQNTDGTLDMPDIYSAFAGPNSGAIGDSIAVGDLNGDGRDDIALGSSSDRKVAVFLQNSGGALDDPIAYATSGGPDSIKIGDLNNDGLFDLVVTLDYQPNIGVYLQQLDGSLGAEILYDSPNSGFTEVDVGDVNNDGLTDVIVTNGTSALSVFLQNLNGTLDAAVTYNFSYRSSKAVGDVTGDGLDDVVITYGYSPGTLDVIAQNVSATLNSPISYVTYQNPDAVEIADVDQDGRNDVIVAHSVWEALGVFLQDANGSLSAYELYDLPYSSFYPQGLAVGDITGDGLHDVALAGGYYGLVVLEHVPGPSEVNSIAAFSGSQQHAALNTAYAQPLKAIVKDQYGNPISGVTVTFTAPASGASGTFADTGTNETTVVTDENGIAAAPVFTANTVDGVFYVEAAVAGVAAPAPFRLISGTVPCYPLTLSHTGSGSDPSATPANSPGCSPGEYVGGENITLTASPDANNLVGSWSGTDDDTSTASTNTVTMPNSAHSAGITYIWVPAAYCSLQSSIPQAECEALVTLYNNTTGTGWANSTGWLEAEDPCTWYGMTCSAGTVTQLQLNNNNLVGSLPTQLGSLTNLQWLSLYNNQLSGSIPAELGNLTNLQVLYLSNNQLSGSIPAELGNLSNLEHLYLFNNQLNGSIPAEVGNLSALKFLYLNFNQLNGSIPAELGGLTNVQHLFLNNNQLSGSIPTQLGGLASVQRLYLSTNQLSGGIPVELGGLSSLVQLYLHNNQLSGGIPAELGGLASLEYLYLSNNQLTGSIPVELGNLAGLLRLSFKDNLLLAGPLPQALSNLTGLALFYYDNTAVCEPQDAAFQTWLTAIPNRIGTGAACANVDLSVSKDNGQAEIYPGESITYTIMMSNVGPDAVSGAVVEDLIPAELTGASWTCAAAGGAACTAGPVSGDINDTVDLPSGGTLTYTLSGTLDLSASGTLANTASVSIPATVNALDGNSGNDQAADEDSVIPLFNCAAQTSIPQAECEALVALYTSTDGPNWTSTTSWFSAPDPCAWNGVTCSAGTVTQLHLNNNNLVGSLPAQLGSLTNLQWLSLYNNQLGGSIPAELGNLSSLQVLYLSNNLLSGSIPSQLGNLASLEHLYLFNNQLSGSIPVELGSLSALKFLYLNFNQLSGSIPTELGSLTNVQHLFLNNNLLSGNIPAQLGNLTGVQRLYLSTNQLSGSIPAELGNLSSLVQLYLHNNQLSGSIPAQLGGLASLEYLYLSNNQLSGSLPVELGNLTGLLRLSVKDNLLLAGPLPQALTNLTGLALFYYDNTAVCEPQDAAFQTWLTAILDRTSTGVTCANVDLSVSKDNGQTDVTPGDPVSYTIVVSNAGPDGVSGALVEDLISAELTGASWTCTPSGGAVCTAGPVSGDINDTVDLPSGGTATYTLSGTLDTGTNSTLVNTASVSIPPAVNALDGNPGNDQAADEDSLTPFLTCASQAYIPEAECEALIALYTSTDGPNWTDNTGWLSDPNPCNWISVNCLAGAVTQIRLTNNNLVGSLPSQLGDLTSLHVLYLYNNQLSGGIPAELGNLTNLEYLYLSNNQLSGNIPAELGNLTNLRWLYLDNNQLSGGIPAELGNLTSLQNLVLNSNQLSGNIPAELGNLTISMRFVFLNNNQLSGNIPAELGNLRRVFFMDLSDNQLSGSIPSELGSITFLEVLHLDNNQLTGGIPVELGSMPNLMHLHLHSNQLSGSIPAELGSLPRLLVLSLSNNQLSGGIPMELGNLSDLESLYLFNNQLSGNIPAQLGNLSALKYLYLNFNQLTGSIPAELGNLNTLQHLILNNNQLSGSIPVELGSLSGLVQLYLHNNQLSGSVPAELGNLASLEYLFMSNNQLVGSIPVELGNLTGLLRLSLNNNLLLAGSLPLELSSITGLTLFYYADTAVCEPQDAAFQTWLTAIPDRTGTGAACANVDLAVSKDNGQTEVVTGDPVSYTIVVSNAGPGAVSGAVVEDMVPAGLTGASWTCAAAGGAACTAGPVSGDINDTVDIPSGGTLTYTLSGTLDAGASGTLSNTASVSIPPTVNAIDGNPTNDQAADEDSVIRIFLSCASQASIPEAECDALVALYVSTDGPNWTTKTGWLTDPDPCNWWGVGCIAGSPGYVGGIQLKWNLLSGSLPNEIVSLSNLQIFDVQGNNIGGTIPSGFGSMLNLEELWLADNQFTGDIPVELVNIPNLSHLLLSGNPLTGTIPPELSNLPSIVYLALAGTGPIPDWIGDYPHLLGLYFNGSNLSGPLPLSLTNLALPLQQFWYDNSNLCAPDDAAFLAWQSPIPDLKTSGITCAPTPTPTPAPSSTPTS